jgi:trehalose 6-phosphate synthase
MQARSGLWFGWSGEIADVAPGSANLTKRQGVTFATIDLPKQEFEAYYGGFCNGT